jgi:hypothetical protein
VYKARFFTLTPRMAVSHRAHIERIERKNQSPAFYAPYVRSMEDARRASDVHL